VTKKIVIRAEKPFTLKEVSCDNKHYQFGLITPNDNTTSKNLYIITVTFKATKSESTQNFHDTIKIITDTQATPLEVTAYANIKMLENRESFLSNSSTLNAVQN
jgi:hypothetical protein